MEMSGQLRAPAALTPGERVPGTQWIGGWLGPGTGADAMEKIKFLASTRNQTPVVQPVA